MTSPTILPAMARNPLSLTLALVLPLAACSVGPEYKARTAAELGVPESYSVSADSQARDAA